MRWRVHLQRMVHWLSEDMPPHPGVREVDSESPVVAADAVATEFRNSGVARAGDWLQVGVPGFAALYEFRMSALGVERHG